MTIKTIALVAHDHKKNALINWVQKNFNLLKPHHLIATHSTGIIIREKLQLQVNLLESGPLGGDQQLGAHIVNDKIDILIFFWDPLEAQPHDPDVRALLRIATVWNIPTACSEASADFIISSPLFSANYVRTVPNYDAYRGRKLNQ